MTITLMIATIDLEPGWAVGTVPLSDPTIDRELLLDTQGRPWVPGSTLAGSLRAHLAAAQPPADTRLMGSRPPHNQADAASSTVSPLWIAGCFFTPQAAGSPDDRAAEVETTGQTAIDRARGSALAGSLRFSRLVTDGGTLTVYLRHDAPAGQALTTGDLNLIAGWRPAIGRDRTKGSGRAALAIIRHGTIDPATTEGARTWLSHSGIGLFEAVATQNMSCDPDGEPWLQERFEIEDGFLTSDGLPSRVARTRHRLGQPLIPGRRGRGSSGPGPSSSSAPATARPPSASSNPGAVTAPSAPCSVTQASGGGWRSATPTSRNPSNIRSAPRSGSTG